MIIFYSYYRLRQNWVNIKKISMTRWRNVIKINTLHCPLIYDETWCQFGLGGWWSQRRRIKSSLMLIMKTSMSNTYINLDKIIYHAFVIWVLQSDIKWLRAIIIWCTLVGAFGNEFSLNLTDMVTFYTNTPSKAKRIAN